MPQSDINNAGEKWETDIDKKCFCMGAYGLGAVYEIRASETTFRPGNIIIHATAEHGEDNFKVCPAASDWAYGVAEWDEAIILNCATDYTSGDNTPGIPFHLNPGAIIRNVTAKDFAAHWECDEPLSMNSGTNGKVLDDIATCPVIMKSCYYVTDPTTDSIQVCYVAITGGAL